MLPSNNAGVGSQPAGASLAAVASTGTVVSRCGRARHDDVGTGRRQSVMAL